MPMQMNRMIIGKSILLFCFVIMSKPAIGMTLSGPITADTVTVSGNVTVSSMTVSTMTVANLFDVKGTANGVKGLVLQTIYSSSTARNSTSNLTLTDIPGMSATIALSNANNYVRISLSGLLQGYAYLDYRPHAKISIRRDSTDLGQGALVTTDNFSGIPVGITITDSPGDTSSHTYQATFASGGGSWPWGAAYFTESPLGYFLIEEISR